MRILAVHSTTSRLGVCLSEDDRVLGAITFPPDRKHLENLAPGIEELSDRLKVDVASIDGFGVAKGPGSFSGIRVGMALIKGMALVLKKPVAGISSLDILAWCGAEEGQTAVAVIDARRKEAYTSVHKKEGNRLQPLDHPRLIPYAGLGDLADRFGARVIVSGEMPFWEETAGGPWEVRVTDPQELAVGCAHLTRQCLQSGESDPLHLLVPLYVRRSDAEERRRTVNRATSPLC